MNSVRVIGPLLGCLVAAVPALAADEAMELLARSAAAARQLNYSGVFVYETTGRMETSRVTHVSVDSHEHEKIERLDGPFQELIRHDDEITCVSPADRVLHVERTRGRRFFPALIPAGGVNIADTYEARLGRKERVAGYDCQVVHLKPRDAFRYGRRLCIEPVHGLLLRSTLRGDGDEVLEQFAFTHVSIGERADPVSIRPSVPTDGWKTVTMPPELKGESGAGLANLPPGYRKAFQYRREGSDHVVYSDGLAAVSVFIEPLSNQRTGSPASPSGSVPVPVGASNVLQRFVADRRVTVVGEVPAATVVRFADSVSRAP